MPDDPATPIRTTRDGHVLWIGLGRPDKLNAFNLAMLAGLAEAYTDYENDPDLRCAVLYAEGKGFTGGLQLDEVGPAVADGAPLFPDEHVDPLAISGRPRTKPVLVAVHGWCLTIGIELILASDITLAAEDARFGQIEVKRGIMPFGGATLRFPRIAGWGDAMRWMLTGDHFDAAEARRMGLVQAVVPTAELQDQAGELAHRIAAQAPMAVQATLAASREAVELGPAAAREHLLEQAVRLMATDDAEEGMRAFLERRPAAFKGR